MYFVRNLENLLENSLHKLKLYPCLYLCPKDSNGARKLHLLSLKNVPGKTERHTVKMFCASSEGEKVRLAAKRHTKDLRLRLQKGKEMVLSSEEKLREKSHIILQDIKDTKSKIKEHVEGIVETENIYTIPNLLCVARMVASPYLCVLILQANYDLALGVLTFAAVTDLLDGWIARTWESQSSKMGSFLDPMADKILISTLFLSLTYADLIPLVLTCLIITRDVVLVAAGFVIRYQSLPPPKTLSRYFDATLATAQLAPTLISKLNTGVQLLLVGTTLAAPVFQYIGHPVLQGLWYVTGATTVAAGVSYILARNTYKVLKYRPPENKPPKI